MFHFWKANHQPDVWVLIFMLQPAKVMLAFAATGHLEISVKQPVKVYKGMPIGQLIYFPVDGEIEVKYNEKKNAKYSDQPDKPLKV